MSLLVVVGVEPQQQTGQRRAAVVPVVFVQELGFLLPLAPTTPSQLAQVAQQHRRVQADQILYSVRLLPLEAAVVAVQR